MVSSFISRLVILVFGTLYPAYSSYKAVRTKNVKEYVKWMMYWIVFALFTCAETFTDLFLSFWFPFYYELKIITVIYLLSPATKGSSLLYRKFVHPVLIQREQEIDEYIAKAKEQGYHTVLSLGSKGVSYATSLIMHTAIKGLPNLPIAPSSEFLPNSNSEMNLILENDSSIVVTKESKETAKKPVYVKELYQKQKLSAETVWVKEDSNFEDDDPNLLFGLQDQPSCSLKSTGDLETDFKSRKRSSSRKLQKRSN